MIELTITAWLASRLVGVLPAGRYQYDSGCNGEGKRITQLYSRKPYKAPLTFKWTCSKSFMTSI